MSEKSQISLSAVISVLINSFLSFTVEIPPIVTWKTRKGEKKEKI